MRWQETLLGEALRRADWGDVSTETRVGPPRGRRGRASREAATGTGLRSAGSGPAGSGVKCLPPGRRSAVTRPGVVSKVSAGFARLELPAWTLLTGSVRRARPQHGGVRDGAEDERPAAAVPDALF